jgi:nitroreductase
MMDYDALLQLIKARRTIRKYKPIPLPDDYVEKIIEAARWAPSGANAQPWEFVVVKSEETREEIVRILQETSESVRGEGIRVPRQSFLLQAPVVIVVCGDPRLKEAYPLGEVREEIFTSSLAAAIQNMHLAATALGLGGSAWGTVPPLAEVRLRDLLGIPHVLRVRAYLPLGYPDHDPPCPFRREVDEILHHGKYDMAKFRTNDDIREFLDTKAMRAPRNFRTL